MKVGDKIVDNDPRIPYLRTLKIIEINETHVRAVTNAGKKVSIRIDRIYSDGKPRKSGFSLREE